MDACVKSSRSSGKDPPLSLHFHRMCWVAPLGNVKFLENADGKGRFSVIEGRWGETSGKVRG